jgi:hypothetical protein
MTIAVDFDGVVHAYRRGWADGSIYDPPLPGAVPGLKALMARDAVFILTSRDPQQVDRWMHEHTDIPTTWEDPAGPPTVTFWEVRGRLLITTRKLPATRYIDDRGLLFESWDQALAELDQPGARSAVLSDRITRARRLHTPADADGRCPVDGQPAPCPTVHALDGRRPAQHALPATEL